MTEYTHPSYGLVQFSRRQGSPKLFGSTLSQGLTNSYVTLSVRKATLIRDEDTDRYYGSMRGDLIEVDLSAAQFAELLTTMNVGMGVPCTVSYVNGQKIPEPPDLVTEAENIRESFSKSLTDFADKLKKEELPEIKEIMEKKNLTKADREKVMRLVNSVVSKMGDSVPFTLELFQEATEKVVQAAKTEVDAFVTTVAHQAGIAALKEKSEDQNPPLLLKG